MYASTLYVYIRYKKKLRMINFASTQQIEI